MTAYDMQSEESKAIDQVEHSKSASAKRTAPQYFNAATGTWGNAPIPTGGSLVWEQHDYVAYTNTNSTTDTYVYRLGGSSGTLVATVVIVYTDSTKSQFSTVTKT